jgi:hypothetical protein
MHHGCASLAFALTAALASLGRGNGRAARPTDARADVPGFEALHPTVTWAHGNFAVAWEDARDRGSQQEEIYLALVDTNGRRGLLRRLTHTEGKPYGNHHPILVSDRAGLGLAWGTDSYRHDSSVQFMRLSKRGDRLSEPIRFDGPFYNHASHALDATPAGYGLVWSSVRVDSDYRSSYALGFADISLTGEVRRRHLLFEPRTGEDSPDIVHLAPVEKGHVVVWRLGFGSTWMTTLSPQVGPIRPVHIHQSDKVYKSAIASSGRELAIVWDGTDRKRSPRGILGFATLSLDGTWRAEPRALASRGTAAAVTSDGEGFAAVWYDKSNYSAETGVYFAQLGSSGELRRPISHVGGRGRRQGGAAIAVGGGQIAVAWIRQEHLKAEVMLSRFSMQGERLAPDVVVSAP